MFSGIIEEIGFIHSIQRQNESIKITIQAQKALEETQIGDSISVNGVCLTVIHLSHQTFTIEAVQETLKRTTLKQLQIDDQVNLERAITPNTRIGGHFTQGHIDAVSEIQSIKPVGSSLEVTFTLPKELSRYVVNKGYIAIDGMSITVIESTKETFSVAFIPQTQASTIVQQYHPRQVVNIEVDILGKYIEKLMISEDTIHAVH